MFLGHRIQHNALGKRTGLLLKTLCLRLHKKWNSYFTGGIFIRSGRVFLKKYISNCLLRSIYLKPQTTLFVYSEPSAPVVQLYSADFAAATAVPQL